MTNLKKRKLGHDKIKIRIAIKPDGAVDVAKSFIDMSYPGSSWYDLRPPIKKIPNRRK